ncbi:MAG: hypothetical protein ACE5FD_01775 [Anaerolineae bacterium]
MEQSRYVSSWYGLPAEIVVENNLWHLVKVGGVALNHPPLVNLWLRWGLPRQDRLTLSFWHEFGHLQTLPVVVVHGLWLWKNGRWRGRGRFGFVRGFIIAWTVHQAVWELASEFYVLVKTGNSYGRIYHHPPGRIRVAAFGVSMLIMMVCLTRWLKKSA